MKFYNLDMVVRSTLMDKRYTIHWYVDFLAYALDCVRDLNLFHDGVVNSKMIKVSPSLTAELPCDYVDYIRVGVAAGTYVKPLVRGITMNRIPDYDSQGKEVKKEVVETEYVGSFNGAWYTNYMNEYGERIGRMFNYDFNGDSFQIVKERNVIALNPQLAGVEYIVLDYISDGIDSDAATHVNPYHIAYIKAYIDERHKFHNRQYSLSEREEARREKEKELRKVRAASDPLTIEDVKRMFRRNHTGTYKG
jgi:hypothetical protein